MIVAFVGNQGSGKTLGLTFNAWFSFRYMYHLVNGFWQIKPDWKIYANYKLKGIDFEPITNIDEIDKMRSGTFFGDEFWSWADSRESETPLNKIISKIILAARKRNVNIFYTTQKLHQMEKRIRDITDMIVVPRLYGWKIIRNEPIPLKCELNWYDSSLNEMKDFRQRFYTLKIFDMYDTTEEISSIEK